MFINTKLIFIICFIRMEMVEKPLLNMILLMFLTKT